MKKTTGKFLDKAERSIKAAERLLRSKDNEFAAGRAYYAMFYATEALLNEKGLRFRKHGGVHAAFGVHFVKGGQWDAKYHRWLLAAFDKRITGDYGIDMALSTKEVKEMIKQAHEFLDEARRSCVTITPP